MCTMVNRTLKSITTHPTRPKSLQNILGMDRTIQLFAEIMKNYWMTNLLDPTEGGLHGEKNS